MKRRLMILGVLAMGIKGYECSAASMSPAFHCKDLLPDKDFQKIIEQSPANFYLDEHVSKAPESPLECIYHPKMNSPIKDGIVHISVVYHDNGKSISAAYASRREMKSFTDKPVDISGLGANSFGIASSPSYFTTLSSNKKYLVDTFYTFDTTKNNPAKEANIARQIATLVDTNLKRY